MRIDFNELKLRASGQWLHLLTKAGIDSHYLKNKNGPCPFCGGADRWRWDDKNGSGSGFCHKCNAQGDGFFILAKKLNLEGRGNFKKLLDWVHCAISSVTTLQNTDSELKLKGIDLTKNRFIAIGTWEQSKPIIPHEQSVATDYLSWRGIERFKATESLRIGLIDSYEEGRYGAKVPAMVAKVTDINGNFLGIHRTYLERNGSGFNYWKKLLGKIAGGAVQLDLAEEVLHLTEGIETALAVRTSLKDQAVWSALSATNLEKLVVPEIVKVVHVWADLDKSKTGERAAHAFASRMYSNGIETYIHLPECDIPANCKSVDWLDIYNQKRGFHA